MGLAACCLMAACGDLRVSSREAPFHPDANVDRIKWSTAAYAVEIPEVSVPPVPARPSRPSLSTVVGSGRCGGDLPTCAIMACESGGNLHAHNPSGADGKWQIMRWDGYGGYPTASSAPEEVQDAKAREMWADGRGRRNWVC